MYNKLGARVGVVTIMILDNHHVAGRLYDQLMIQRARGFQAVFGIMTTYTDWRICWLDTEASNMMAGANTICSPPFYYALGKEHLDEVSDLERRIVATSIISFNSADLLPLLASALLKVSNSVTPLFSLCYSPLMLILF